MVIARLLTWWRSRGRRIYAFHDGRRRRVGDPIVLYRALTAAGGEKWEEHLETLARPRPMLGLTGPALADYQSRQEAAAKKLVEAVRTAFGVPPLDDRGRGLTEAETVALAADFLGFLGGLAGEGETPFGSTWPAPGSPSTPDASPTGSRSLSGTPATA